MTKAPKVQYSEHEAAAQLGVTVEQLRGLVRFHIVKDGDVDQEESAVPVYQAADLVMLRILARMAHRPGAVHA